MVEIPTYGLAQAVLEAVARPPAELGRDLGSVDGVACVVARPVGDEIDQLGAWTIAWHETVENFANLLDDLDRLKRYRELGIDRVVFSLPAETDDKIMPILDRWADLNLRLG